MNKTLFAIVAVLAGIGILFAGCLTEGAAPTPSSTPEFSTQAQASGAFYGSEYVVKKNIANATISVNTTIAHGAPALLKAVYINTSQGDGGGNGTNATVKIWDWRNTLIFTTGTNGVANTTSANDSVNVFVGRQVVVDIGFNQTGSGNTVNSTNASINGNGTRLYQNWIQVELVFNNEGISS